MTNLLFGRAVAINVDVSLLDQAVIRGLDELTVEPMLELLTKVRETRKHLQQVEAFIENRAAKVMPGKTLEWSGGHATRHKTAKHVTWLSDDLAREVALRTMVDKETGELPSEPVTDMVSHVVSAITDCGAFSYWRVGQLGPLGIEVDDFRHSEPGRWVVEVDTAEQAAEVEA